MTFHSIPIEETEASTIEETLEVPALLVDLYLDQIIGAVVAGRHEIDLILFFYTALNGMGAIRHRQEVMREKVIHMARAQRLVLESQTPFLVKTDSEFPFLELRRLEVDVLPKRVRIIV